MEKSGIMIKKTLLATFVIIAEAGKYKIPVLSNVTEAALVDDGDGNNPRYIINLRAIAQDKLAQVQEVFKDKEEVPIEDTNGLFMTCNAWVRRDNEGKFTVMPELPVKGEEIEAVVAPVKSRDAEEVLRVTNHRVIAAKRATRLDITKLFKTEEAPENKEEKVLETAQ